MNPPREEMTLSITNAASCKRQDDIPQRPFRRLSGSSSRLTNSFLFALPEFSGDEEEYDDLSEHQEDEGVTPKKMSLDVAPRKPSQCARTAYIYEEEDTTIFTNDLLECYAPLGGGSNSHLLYCNHASEEVKAREQPNQKAPAKPIPPDAPPLLVERKRVIEEFWRLMNEHNVEGLRQICTPDWQVSFRGAKQDLNAVMGFDEFIHQVSAVFNSLPNMHFMYRAIEESQDMPGEQLVLHDFVGTGNHTGSAFALGGLLPPIEATGKKVVLDECQQHYSFAPNTNKMSGFEEIALGETTGILGVYAILSQP